MSWLKAKDWATGVEYSSLFHSGLRAISLRPRVRGARSNSSRSSSREKSLSDGASLSSRLVTRRTTRTRHPSPSISVSTDPCPLPLPPVAHRRPSSMFVQPTKEIRDRWSSEESFIEIEEHPKFPEEEHRCVGYLVLPIEMDTKSRSFFLNLGEVDASTGEESFLSLSNSQDVLLHHPIPRRARPSASSILAMSCDSSLHRPRTKWERGDCAWMLEESSPELSAYEVGDEEEDEEEDWRQFHVDWLRNIGY